MNNTLKTAIQVLTRFSFRSEGEGEGETRNLLAFLPLVAAGIGILLWLAAALAVRLAGPVAGTLLGAIAVPWLFRWLTGRPGLSTLALLAKAAAGSRESDEQTVYARVIALQTLLLVEAGSVGVLIATGNAFWLAVAVTLSGAAFAEYLPDAGGGTRGPAFAHWGVAAVLSLVFAGLCGHFAPGVFALVIGWLFVPAVRRPVEGLGLDTPDGAIVLVSESCRLLLLAAGALYFLGR